MANQVQEYLSKNNLEIDFTQVYHQFNELDKIKSKVNINAGNNQKLIEYISKPELATSVSSYVSNVVINPKDQESRISAFYRMIGLPVVAKDGSFYSPGYDKVNLPKDTDYKYKVIGKMDTEILKLLSLREQYYSSTVPCFFNKRDFAASLYALSSYNIRNFLYLEKSKEPFDKLASNQSYKNPLIDPSGKYLSEYLNNSGNKVTISADRYHLIKPFIVDPRIDMTVFPIERRICVPFTEAGILDQRMINSSVSLPIPYIETIIKTRLAVSKSNSNEGNKEIIDYIKKFIKIQDVSLVKNITELNFTESFVFVQNLDRSRALIKRLYNAQQKINEVCKDYHWIPIPNIGGPESGCITKELYNKDVFLKPIEKSILYAESIQNLYSILKQATEVIQNESGQKTEEFQDLESSYNNIITEGIVQNRSQRKDSCNEANNALFEIEAIMGEFSGIGQCDMLAMIAALNLMDLRALVSLIDEPAFTRMQKIYKYGETQIPVTEALKQLELKIKDWYSIMQIMYDSFIKGDGSFV